MKLAKLLLAALSAQAGDWTPPVEVRHEETLCLTYQARMDGPYLVVRAKIEPGWHTFSMDNKRRAEEKLAGKPSLGIDRPTEVTLTGLQPAGPWYQSAPKDFSRPELRWFSWGFEQQAIFALKVKGPAPSARIGIRGQACTETTCKNIDTEVTLKQPRVTPGGGELDIAKLIQVR
jgi:hypothetical protein